MASVAEEPKGRISMGLALKRKIAYVLVAHEALVAVMKCVANMCNKC